MQPLQSCKVAPSPRLLHFLRSQVDSLFPLPSQVVTQRASKPPQRRLLLHCPRSRPFTTSSRRPATYQASLFPTELFSRVSDARSVPSSVPRLKTSILPFRRPSNGDHSAQRWGSGLPWLGLKQKHKGKWSKDWTNAPPRDDLSSPFGFDSNGSTLLSRIKGPNELKLRCTELDENGKVTVVDGEFKKSELIARFGLLPRDLRKIDSSMLPSIIVRPSTILINLVHLRVLVRHNRVLILDVYGSTASYAQSIFMYDLQGKLAQRDGSSSGLPYEFRALEAVLVSVTSGLEVEFDGVRDPVVRVLRALEEDIDREKLRYLLIYSKRLGAFEQKARLVREAIEGLLEDDGDLSTMYLTETAQGRPRDAKDHSEIEMLLESYHKVTDEIVESSATLVSEIRNTEEIVKAILDANRNALMLLDLKFSIGTLSMGSGAFVAALYGMNLKNFMEESNLGFWSVSGISGALAAMVCIYGLLKLHRVRRISMWGEGGRQNRGSWRDVDLGMRGRLDAARLERVKRLKEARKEGRCEDARGLLDGSWAEADAVGAASKGAKLEQ